MILKIDNTNASLVPLRLPLKDAAAAQRCARARAETTAGIAPNAQPFPQEGEDHFDVAKVNAIKDEIRSGRHAIDPARIADGMLASLRELLPRSSE